MTDDTPRDPLAALESVPGACHSRSGLMCDRDDTRGGECFLVDRRDVRKALDARPSGDEALNNAYRERNAVVAALIRTNGWKASLIPAPDAEGWWIVYAETPAGQVSWHIAPVDIRLFDGIPVEYAKWDGHTTDEKYERIAALAAPVSPLTCGDCGHHVHRPEACAWMFGAGRNESSCSCPVFPSPQRYAPDPVSPPPDVEGRWCNCETHHATWCAALAAPVSPSPDVEGLRLFNAVRAVITEGIDAPGLYDELHVAFYAIRDRESLRGPMGDEIDVDRLTRAVAAAVYESDPNDDDRRMAEAIAREYAALAAPVSPSQMGYPSGDDDIPVVGGSAEQAMYDDAANADDVSGDEI